MTAEPMTPAAAQRLANGLPMSPLTVERSGAGWEVYSPEWPRRRPVSGAAMTGCFCWANTHSLGHDGHCCFVRDDRNRRINGGWKTDDEVCHLPTDDTSDGRLGEPGLLVEVTAQRSLQLRT